MSKKSYYKLDANKAFNYLSKEQKKLLFGNNIFLQIETLKKDFSQRGILIAYDLDREPHLRPVRKVIPKLIAMGTKVACLPKQVFEQVQSASDWTHGKSSYRQLKDGRTKVVHASYYLDSGRKKETVMSAVI